MDEHKFWMVWCIGTLPPAYRHKIVESARREAERLARENKGCAFVVLEAIAMVRQPELPLEWKNDLEEEIPF